MSNYNELYRERMQAKEQERQRREVTVKRAYRPVGFLVVVSVLVFLQLSDMGMPLPYATLLTVLVALLTIIFS